MRFLKTFFMVSMGFLIFSSLGLAGDFDWLKDFNIRAEADPSGFKARLGARFKIGNAEIDAVLSNVEKPADAYMVFRLGEMAQKPSRHVAEQYKKGKGKGWGVLAKNLGIKPGSKEFKALKNGDDLYDEKPKGKDKSESKDKKKSKDSKKSKSKGKK